MSGKQVMKYKLEVKKLEQVKKKGGIRITCIHERAKAVGLAVQSALSTSVAADSSTQAKLLRDEAAVQTSDC